MRKLISRLITTNTVSRDPYYQTICIEHDGKYLDVIHLDVCEGKSYEFIIETYSTPIPDQRDYEVFLKS